MHELLLWDEARDMTTALQQRSVTKTPSTQGLIGYWKMDEGEGMTLTDYARNRHMTMAAETWHIETLAGKFFTTSPAWEASIMMKTSPGNRDCWLDYYTASTESGGVHPES